MFHLGSYILETSLETSFPLWTRMCSWSYTL